MHMFSSVVGLSYYKKANISRDSTGKKDFHSFSVHNFGCSKFWGSISYFCFSN